MPTRRRNLDEIRPVACPMQWLELRPEDGHDRSRFCDQCSLSVHDAAQYTRPEVEDLLAQSGRICMRLAWDAEGRLITRERLHARTSVEPVAVGWGERARSLVMLAAGWFLMLIATLPGCRRVIPEPPRATAPSAAVNSSSCEACDAGICEPKPEDDEFDAHQLGYLVTLGYIE